MPEDTGPREDGGTRSADARGRRTVERTRGVYMISVAAELAGMHPQTLRIYESRGLITPKRSAKNTRLYSEDDVERLRRIQELTGEMGMNLAGVERVFELEQELERMRRRVQRMEREAEEAREALEREIERVKRSFKRELVPYQPPGADLIPARELRGVRIPVSRQRRRGWPD
jgi:MerR family transcriptional regulator, heat shock protein HspR